MAAILPVYVGFMCRVREMIHCGNHHIQEEQHYMVKVNILKQEI